MSRGTIFLLGGINDFLFVTRAWKIGLQQAGLPHQLETVRWQQGTFAVLTFKDLWNTRHHKAEACRLAERIRETQLSKPGEAIHIISHSAGTALSVYALEELGPSQAITSAVLVGSALSPDYDLQAASQSTQAGLLCVESRLDCFYLGLGTLLLGTANRRWKASAGMVGFRHLPPAVQVRRWHWKDTRFGWFGGHLSVASSGFSREVLAPWILSSERLAQSGLAPS